MQNHDPNKCECTSYEQKKTNLLSSPNPYMSCIYLSRTLSSYHVHSAAPSLVALLRVFSLLPSLLTTTTLSTSGALFCGFFSLCNHYPPLRVTLSPSNFFFRFSTSPLKFQRKLSKSPNLSLTRLTFKLPLCNLFGIRVYH